MQVNKFLLYLAAGILAFCAIYFVMVTFIPIPATGAKYADVILGALISSGFTAILSFYFGSSKSSQDKDAKLPPARNYP